MPSKSLSSKQMVSKIPFMKVVAKKQIQKLCEKLRKKIAFKKCRQKIRTKMASQLGVQKQSLKIAFKNIL